MKKFWGILIKLIFPPVQKKMNIITGLMVCIIVICMAVFMIVRANKKLKLLERSVRNG